MSEYELSLADLQQTFEVWKRWVAQGSLPYYHGHFGSGPRQHYYDDYHDHIEREDPTPRAGIGGRYKFSIQTSDSPEGDTWVVGVFIANELGTIVEIVTLDYFTDNTTTGTELAKRRRWLL